MLSLSRRTIVATGLVAAIGAAIPATLAATTSNAQPADKAVAAASHVKAMDPNTTAPILSATFKTSKPEDLLISLSAECSILTDVLIAGNSTPGAKDDQTAAGTIKMYLNLDGKIVPLTDTSAPPQDPNANGNGSIATDSVTFCNQVHRRTVGDSENPQDGIDQSEDWLTTKSAADFNWVRLNAGSGDHTLQVFAQFTDDSSTPNAHAEGYVGNRTLIIEPTKLANNAVISDTGTN